MNVGIYKGAAALGAYEKWQEILAENLASGSVPGFKRNEISFAAYGKSAVKASARANDGSREVMPQATSRINFAQGEIRHTGGDLDFAIQGDGLFQIQRPNGQMGYTRNGQFHLKADRTLVTSDGLSVMGENGPITFPTGAGAISINPDGIIFQGEQQVAKLAIYNFKDLQKLHRVGDGLMGPTSAAEQPIPAEKPNILGGYIEQSNVSPVHEMVNLIAVSRAYEACQKVIQSHDDDSDKSIQILGNPTA